MEDPQLAACRAWLGRALESPAYRRFCRLHLGAFWGQLSPCPRYQRDTLLKLCPRRSGDRLLDLGCGSGGLAALLARRLGCTVTGFDRVLPPTSEQTTTESRLKFEAADLMTLEQPPESAEAVLLVDVLALLPEPRMLLRRWLRWLTPGGRILVLGHSLSNAPGPTDHRSQIARWLEELGMGVSEIDFDRFEEAFWQRQRRLVETLAEDFVRCGDRPLLELLRHEAARILPWAEAGRSHRRLTIGRKGDEERRSE